MSNFAAKFVFRKMKKSLFFAIVSAIFLLGSCAKEFNAVYKSDDANYKYEYAKEQYAKGRYSRASLLFGDLVTITKGTDIGEECLYMYGMSTYNSKDYESASEIFRKYASSYPKGRYAEVCSFFVGESLFKTTPEPRLDQTPTYAAMKAYQEFMDLFPASKNKTQAEQKLFELQDKLVLKEFYNAQLYYNLGTYFGNCTGGGNNYEACIITAQNALKDYPFTSLREKFASLIMKSKYSLAVHSVKEKQTERFQNAEDECYGFLNEYPDSEDKELAEKYIEKCKRYTQTGEVDEKN